MQDVEEREYQIESYLSDIASGQLLSVTIRIPENEIKELETIHSNLLFTIERTYIDNGRNINITNVSKKLNI